MICMIENLESRVFLSKSTVILADEAAITTDLSAISVQRVSFAEEMKKLRVQLAADLRTRAADLKILRDKMVMDRKYWADTIKDDKQTMKDTLEVDSESIAANRAQLKADTLAENQSLIEADNLFLQQAIEKFNNDKTTWVAQIAKDRIQGAQVLAADHQSIVTYMQHDAVVDDRLAIRDLRTVNQNKMTQLFSQLRIDRKMLQDHEKQGL